MARGWRLPGGVSPAWRLRAALCHSGPWMAKEGGVGRDGSPEGGPHPGRDAGLAGGAGGAGAGPEGQAKPASE